MKDVRRAMLPVPNHRDTDDERKEKKKKASHEIDYGKMDVNIWALFRFREALGIIACLKFDILRFIASRWKSTAYISLPFRQLVCDS